MSRDLGSAEPIAVITAAKKYWRSFLPVWFFPFVLFLIVFLPAFADHAATIFIFLIVPVYAICYYFASVPLRKGQVTRGQFAILALLFPFLLWSAVIFGFWSLLTMLQAATS